MNKLKIIKIFTICLVMAGALFTFPGNAPAPTYKTPDVYVEEINIFPPSVAEVETSIPAVKANPQDAEIARIEKLLDSDQNKAIVEAQKLKESLKKKFADESDSYNRALQQAQKMTNEVGAIEERAAKNRKLANQALEWSNDPSLSPEIREKNARKAKLWEKEVLEDEQRASEYRNKVEDIKQEAKANLDRATLLNEQNARLDNVINSPEQESNPKEDKTGDVPPNENITGEDVIGEWSDGQDTWFIRGKGNNITLARQRGGKKGDEAVYSNTRFSGGSIRASRTHDDVRDMKGSLPSQIKAKLLNNPSAVERIELRLVTDKEDGTQELQGKKWNLQVTYYENDYSIEKIHSPYSTPLTLQKDASVRLVLP